MRTIFKYLKASQFIPNYAGTVKQYKHKIRGKSGHKQPIDFTEEDKKAIREGVKKLFSDLKKA